MNLMVGRDDAIPTFSIGQRVIRSSPVDTSSGSSSSAASGEWEGDKARVGQPEREGREAGKLS